MWTSRDKGSSDGPFERNAQQFLRLNREFHRQLLQHLLGKTVDDQCDGFFGVQATGLGVEHLIIANLAGRCLMFDLRAWVAHFDIGHGVGTA